MATVTLDRLSKRYPGAHDDAVSDVSFDVADGEFMVLLGPSGCGKSTTLRMVAGLETISGGDVSIDGVRMNEIAAKDRDIAMVFQSYALYPHMSVYDNMAFGLRRRSLPPGGDRAPGARGGGNAGTRHRCSNASRMRCPAASASASRSDARSCATPRSSCSTSRCRTSTPRCASACAASYARCTGGCRPRCSMSRHDQVEAMTMGDRICIMEGGRVAQIGAPLEV